MSPNTSKRNASWFAALLCLVIVSCYGYVIHGFATDHSPPDRPAAQPEALPDAQPPAVPDPAPAPQAAPAVPAGP